MAMAGGDLSAVLIDLTGLQFGKALLSALGMPQKTAVQCFVGDLEMKRGVVDFKTMTLDTGEAIVNVGGNVDLAEEKIDLNLKTNSQAFLRRFAADAHQHQRHVQGPVDPAGRRGRGPGRRGGRIGRLVRAAGDLADDPVRHLGGGGRALRRVVATGTRAGRRQGAPGAAARHQGDKAPAAAR